MAHAARHDARQTSIPETCEKAISGMVATYNPHSTDDTRILVKRRQISKMATDESQAKSTPKILTIATGEAPLAEAMR